MNTYAKLGRCSNKRVNIAPGVVFAQERYQISSKRFTNFYWTELDNSKVEFELVNYEKPKPLRNFQLAGRKILSAINFGSFFLCDGITPREYLYNLFIQKGIVFQFPNNYRSLIEIADGKMSVEKLEAVGWILMNGKKYIWKSYGSDSRRKSDLVVYGLFNINICKYIDNSGCSKRRIADNSRIVSCERGELMLGVLRTKRYPIVAKISGTRLDITKYAFVLKGKQRELKKVDIGSEITKIVVGGKLFTEKMSACNGSFSLGHSVIELKDNLYKELEYKNGDLPNPMKVEYLKSWSVVLSVSDNKTIFVINDARPGVNGEEGLNVFELQNYLLKKFKYDWAIVGDSGQSSKLRVKNGIYGNKHYKNYFGEESYWDGVNGRPIPVALLAYER